MSLDPLTPETGPEAPRPKPVVAYCRACGKGLASDQIVNYSGTVYCADHAPRTAEAAPNNPYTAPPYVSAAVSPGLAFVLGLIPGVGAIYNGQYAKGFVHVLATGVVFSLADKGAGLEMFGPILVFAWFFYMAFEAYHTARRRILGEPVDEFSSILPRQDGTPAAPIGPLLLIGLGVILLLHQLDLIDLYRIRRYVAPTVLIASGLFLLYGRLKNNGTARPSGDAASEGMFHGRS